MNIKLAKNRQKVLEVIYCVAMVMLLLRQLSGMMQIVPYFSKLAAKYGNHILGVACFLFGIIIVLNCRMEFKSLLKLCFIGWSIATYFISNTSVMLIGVFMILAIQGLDTRKIIMVWFVVMGIVLATSIVTYIFLFSSGSGYIQYMGVKGVTRIRYYFFFNHPNSIALCCVYFVLAFVYLWAERLPAWVTCGGVLIGCVFEFFGPCSYTALMIMAVLFIMLCLFYFCPKVFYVLSVIEAPIILLGTAVGISAFYFNDLQIPYNPITHTLVMRFEQGAAALAICPMNLLGQTVTYMGQDIEWHGKILNAVSLDMGYAAMLVYYGIVGVGIFLIGMIGQYYRDIRQKNGIQVLVLSAVLLYGAMEWPALYTILAFPLLLTGKFFGTRKEVQ